MLGNRCLLPFKNKSATDTIVINGRQNIVFGYYISISRSVITLYFISFILISRHVYAGCTVRKFSKI